MAVTTWSFGSGYEGFSFENVSSGGGNASRTHVSGAIKNTLTYQGLPTAEEGAGLNTSQQLINATTTAGDTIEFDYDASPDSIVVANRITAYYTDETTDTLLEQKIPAGTFTLPLTGGKVLDYFEIRLSIGNAGGAPARNTSRNILEVRLTTAVAITPTAGRLRTPQAVIDEQSDGGGGMLGGDGGGSGGNLASISADGLYIYISAFNNLGFPVLVKILAALTTDGSIVFDPGSGSRIGVQTGKFDATTIWVAGLFDGTNTVEKSEDAGVSFAVKDDASFGAIRTFEVGPDLDTRVIVYDGDNGDIIETLDDGETWTTINATVTQLVNSISRFDVNVEEIVIGNQGAANNSINYSPNSGADLEDFQTGVYPNADATKVIAN